MPCGAGFYIPVMKKVFSIGLAFVAGAGFIPARTGPAKVYMAITLIISIR
jgi:hypothetical protein